MMLRLLASNARRHDNPAMKRVRQVRFSEFPRMVVGFLSVLLLVSLPVSHAEEASKQEKNTKAKTNSGKNSPEEEEEPTVTGSAASGLNAAQLLPIGIPSRNVRMPEFEEDILVSKMIVRELTRISDDELDILDMRLERYRPDGSLDHVVLIERGFYSISTGQLVSRTPTRLEGRNMILIGEGCDYSPDSPVVKILGNIRSYIDPNGIRPASEEKEP